MLLEEAQRGIDAPRRDPQLVQLLRIGAEARARLVGQPCVEEAMHLDVPAPVITLSLLTRFRSRQPESFGAKVIAALRNEFGGHAVKSA